MVSVQNFADIDPDDISRLSVAEQQELLRCMEQLIGGMPLADWIAHHFPAEPPPFHLMPVINALEEARVRPIRLCFAIGPGHAKTVTLLRGIVWWLTKSPADQCAYISYSAGQAVSKSRIAMEYAEQVGLKLANEAAGHWRTAVGGGLIAAGSRGKLTGQRVPGLLVVDDPYKDELEARSPAIGHAVKERFKGIAFTRLQGGSIIVLHTRWAEDDLIGWLTRDLKWDCVNIQTVCDDVPDALGRKIGEVAWPEKYPYEICSQPCGHDGHLAEIRATIGEHLWSAMYQGRPRPLGTAVFHEPARVAMDTEFVWTGKRGVISVDPAATAKTSADWSVIMTCAMEGFGADSVMTITDVVRLQCEIPELVARCRRVQLGTRLMIACEAVAGFKGVPQMLRQMDSFDDQGRPLGKLRVFDVNPGTRDKFSRAQPVAAAWNAGRVLIPKDRPWAEGLISRFQRFTGVGDREDDEIDAAAQAWNVLYRTKKPEEKRMYDGGGL